MSIRFRRATRLSLEPRMFGFGYDSGFYDGGKYVFFQIGFAVWGLWFE